MHPLRDVIHNRHRFVVIDDETYKEKLSFRLTGINLIASLGIGVVLLIVITSVLIIFTPLRRVIPGYINNEMIEQIHRDAYRLDSLQHEIDRQQWFIVNLQDIISGKQMPGIDEAQRRTDSLANLGISVETYRHSTDDSLLRSEMLQAQKRQSLQQYPVVKQ